jgi:molybdate transport system substrate-binding protein|tara:strand:+ start:27884 stop:28621 length:738 start_codon:yes stop_codon:yes gene_type:complete
MRILLATVTVLIAVFLNGCGSGSHSIRVFAASSLTEVVQHLAEEYETRYPNTDVELNIAGSGTLVMQLQEGADADLVILASRSHMDQLRDIGLVRAPKQIAQNSLAVIVSPELVKDIGSIDDVRRTALQIAVCVKSSPCGALAWAYASSVGLDLSSATHESNVKAVLAKVERDEVDVGIVYMSDLRTSREQLGHLANARADQYSTSYPLAVTTDSKARRAAENFAALFAEPVGQSALTHFGFQLP